MTKHLVKSVPPYQTNKQNQIAFRYFIASYDITLRQWKPLDPRHRGWALPAAYKGFFKKAHKRLRDSNNLKTRHLYSS